MAANSKIEWTDATWSPLRVRVKLDAAEIAKSKGYTSLIQIVEKTAGQPGQHCEHVSEGCEHCYSETWQGRCLKVNGTGLPFDRRSRDLVEPFVDERILVQPFKWRDSKVFVENQSDLFGEWFTDEMIDCVFAAIGLCNGGKTQTAKGLIPRPVHFMQVLTKRADRLLSYVLSRTDDWAKNSLSVRLNRRDFADPVWVIRGIARTWFGVSVEDQATADARIPLLLQTPAALRFVSYEPALGPVSFERWTEAGLECGNCEGSGCETLATDNAGPSDDPGFGCPKCGEMCAHTPLDELLGAEKGISWVITGGESGPGARPPHPDWFRSARDQCVAAGVPFFFKQWGAWKYPSVLGGGGWQYVFPDGTTLDRVGKKKAGALLDGQAWKQFPEVSR